MSLAEKKEWTYIEKKVTESEDWRLKSFDIKIPTEIDKDGFKGQEEVRDKIPTYADCLYEGMVDVIQKGDDEKDALIEGVKSIKIAFGSDPFKLENNCLLVHLDSSTENPGRMKSSINDWLMNNLG